MTMACDAAQTANQLARHAKDHRVCLVLFQHGTRPFAVTQRVRHALIRSCTYALLDFAAERVRDFCSFCLEFRHEMAPTTLQRVDGELESEMENALTDLWKNDFTKMAHEALTRVIPKNNITIILIA